MLKNPVSVTGILEESICPESVFDLRIMLLSVKAGQLTLNMAILLKRCGASIFVVAVTGYLLISH